MRQIRFKARAKKTKEWVEGYYATIHETITDDDDIIIGIDERPVIFSDEPGYHDRWVRCKDIYPQTLCQQTDMEDADGIKIWENDILRLSPFGKPESQYTGDVVWMQTCFAVEDDRGHHEPLATLRNLCKIEVIGNRYDEA